MKKFTTLDLLLAGFIGALLGILVQLWLTPIPLNCQIVILTEVTSEEQLVAATLENTPFQACTTYIWEQ